MKLVWKNLLGILFAGLLATSLPITAQSATTKYKQTTTKSAKHKKSCPHKYKKQCCKNKKSKKACRCGKSCSKKSKKKS